MSCASGSAATSPTEIRGLKFDTVYTLVETAAPNGYEVAESIRFKLVQRKDENGDLLNAERMSMSAPAKTG